MRAKTRNFLLRQREVLKLKATDDGTGKPMSFGQIGVKLGITSNGACYYVIKLRQGRCPCCYRKLNKLKTA